MTTIYKLCVTLCIITACVQGLVQFPYLTLFAEENTDFINKTIQKGLIPSSPTRSVFECSMMCLRYFCQAVFFNAVTYMCTLTHLRLYNPNVTKTEIGSRYYMTFYESCPANQGYVYYPTENFCVKLNTTKVIYPDTQYYCVLERASIVRVDSVTKLNLLKNLLYNKGYNQTEDFAYILSQPISMSNNFAFDDGTVMPYYDWMPGRPDTYGQRIVIGGSTQQFDDVHEMEEHGFICEKYLYKRINV